MKQKFIKYCEEYDLNNNLLDDLSETAWDIIETIFEKSYKDDIKEFFRECILLKFENVYNLVHYYDKEQDDIENIVSVFKLELDSMDSEFELLRDMYNNNL